MDPVKPSEEIQQGSPEKFVPKEEPIEYHDSPSPAPLDLCVKNSNHQTAINDMEIPYSYPRPEITYGEDHSRNSRGSSPRSCSSGTSPELPSNPYDNFVGFSTKYPIITQRTKPTRPFKAYPKDPISIGLGAAALDPHNLQQDYVEFRNKIMTQVQAQSNNSTNKNMRRSSITSQNAHNTDPTYWEKRRKNNEAAKRSRDARRAKEDEIAIRCAFLERDHIRLSHENNQLKQEALQLKYTMTALQAELEKLRGLLYR